MHSIQLVIRLIYHSRIFSDIKIFFAQKLYEIYVEMSIHSQNNVSIVLIEHFSVSFTYIHTNLILNFYKILYIYINVVLCL